MSRAYPETTITSTGKVVGFKLRISRDGSTYFVFFNDRSNKRKEISTNCTGVERARAKARQIIEEAYKAPEGPTSEKVSWDEATERLKARFQAAGIRPKSVRFYIQVFGYVRTMYSVTDGPTDISPGMAQTWADQFATSKGRNGKPRSPFTAFNVIRAASVLWEKWLLNNLKIVNHNPFQEVQPPKTDKPTVRIPSQDQLTAFTNWLHDRFPDWQLPHVFFEVKALTGCRLSDLCHLRPSQIRDGRIHFAADQTKGRKARSVPLPEDLTKKLQAVAGKRYLWDRYPTELKAKLKEKGYPTHQIKTDFDPERMVGWVMTLFVDFNKDQPEGSPKLTSHQFRKLAFTKAWEAGIDPKKASIAIGCNVDTMLKHYVQLDEQDVTDEVFAKLHSHGAS